MSLPLTGACDRSVPAEDTGSDPTPVDTSTTTNEPAGQDTDASHTTTCLASDVLRRLGKTRLLVGVTTNDETIASSVPYDIRYIYITGGLSPGSGPSSTCKVSEGYQDTGWWGCWQWDQLPPGQYLRDFVAKTTKISQIPLITYYQMLAASGYREGAGEVQAAANSWVMSRYFNDWRFTLQQIGQAKAILHIEPDFWGYAEQVNQDPRYIAAAVASANPTDCSWLPNTIAGMGRCMIAMARKYAPNAVVGLHASAFGGGPDALTNRDPAFNVTAHAQKVASFLNLAGATYGDFIMVEASDRDSGYYSSVGRDFWWDPNNAKLPTFNQAFTWVRALSASLGRPSLWWQLPVGNMGLPNQPTRYKDNRVEYFFSHLPDVASTHAFGMVFGPGATNQTNPATDNGLLNYRTKQYVSSGGQACR